MALINDVAPGSTAGHHCPTCTCGSADESDASGTSDSETSDSTTTSFKSLENEVDNIDEQIRRMTDALAALRRRRNAQLAIACIPPELLSEIFLYFRDATTPHISEYWTTVPWICITHVSTYWRYVALDNPRLWTILNLRFPHLVRQFSKYCADMPLHVVLSHPKVPEDWDEYDADDVDYGFICYNTLPNPIVALGMNASWGEIQYVLEFRLHGVEETVLLLDLNGCEPTVGDAAGTEELSFPRLQTLALGSLSMTLSATVFTSCAQSLRELKLDDCALLAWDPEDFEMFTSLEKLRIVYSFFVSQFEHEVDTRLPTLKELYIEENLDICVAALDALHTPPGSHVILCPIAGKYRCTEGVTLEQLVSVISAVHPDHAYARITDTFVELHYDGGEESRNIILKLLYDSNATSGLETLATILPHSTTELSIICHANTAYKHNKLRAFDAICSLSVCGRSFVVSLNSGLCNDAKLLPNLSSIQVCSCSAGLERKLSRAAKVRKLDVRVSTSEICRSIYSCGG